MSEFGSGIVVPLAKFSEHISVWHLKYRTMHKHSTSLTISDSIELWLNGASDHFYNLDESAGPKLKKLARLTLDIGHGFTGRTYTEETFLEVLKLWEESCLELDKRLGVSADWGAW